MAKLTLYRDRSLQWFKATKALSNHTLREKGKSVPTRAIVSGPIKTLLSGSSRSIHCWTMPCLQARYEALAALAIWYISMLPLDLFSPRLVGGSFKSDDCEAFSTLLVVGLKTVEAHRVTHPYTLLPEKHSPGRTLLQNGTLFKTIRRIRFKPNQRLYSYLYLG